jgi:subtilisin-like proprotein convertase family protein
MMNHPLDLPYGRWTASTEEFAGQALGGEWIIEVIDEGGARVLVEWAQVMVGVRE